MRKEKKKEWRDYVEGQEDYERAAMRTYMDQSNQGQDQMASNGTCGWAAGSLVGLD